MGVSISIMLDCVLWQGRLSCSGRSNDSRGIHFTSWYVSYSNEVLSQIEHLGEC